MFSELARASIVLPMAAVLSGCASAPAITASFDDTCEILENPIYEVSFSRRSAISRLEEKTLALGGDTLLVGQRGLEEIREYEERMEMERLLRAPTEERIVEIENPIAIGVRVPEGQTVVWGAVLRCEDGDNAVN